MGKEARMGREVRDRGRVGKGKGKGGGGESGQSLRLIIESPLSSTWSPSSQIPLPRGRLRLSPGGRGRCSPSSSSGSSVGGPISLSKSSS